MVMDPAEMHIRYRGLIREALPSGTIRWRVRVERNPNRRITLNVDPDHVAFLEHYHAARAGVQLPPPEDNDRAAIEHTISWLTFKHLEFLERATKAGQTSPLTVKKRKGLYQRLRNHCGEYALNMPPKAVIALRDEMAETPAYADSMVEAVRSLFDWAIEREICDTNPALGIKRIDAGRGGAVAWTLPEIRQFIGRHSFGTPAYTTLMLFLFTACRIGDAIHLGREHEFEFQGTRFIGWQPSKKGSASVEVPMVPQLYEATRAGKIVGKTYLIKRNGEPYRAADNLGQQFRKWVRQAELGNRSAHGIRKSVGNILADLGFNQYTIMSIHGHTEAKTSEVYTRGVERRSLAREAMMEMAKIRL